METENTPVTILEGLKLITPQALAWRADAKLVFLTTPSNFLSIDGKDTDWVFHTYSLKSNRWAIFVPFKGKTEEYPAGRFEKTHAQNHWNFDYLNNLKLLDSDNFAEKLDTLGTIENRNGKLWVIAGGFSNWTGKLGHPQWSGQYYNVRDKSTWSLFVDMQTGEISFNERQKIQPVEIDFEKGMIP